MGYRQDWLNANRSSSGLYQCVACHKWFKESEIDIDHIVPQNKGGTDELWNLQCMCKHCNRSKQDDMSSTAGNLTANVIKNVMQGNRIDNVGGLIGSMVRKNTENAILQAIGIKKPRRKKR